MKKHLSFSLCIMLMLAVLVSTTFACEVRARSMSVDGHWHHNWTIAPWINYWQSSVMSASASITSDTSGHTITPSMTVKRGSTTYLNAAQRGSWSLTVSNTLLTGTMSNQNWGLCSSSDCNIAKRTVYDSNWSFDNKDPR